MSGVYDVAQTYQLGVSGGYDYINFDAASPTRSAAATKPLVLLKIMK
jgi:hypothetical protein